jgi:hypothetical protein
MVLDTSCTKTTRSFSIFRAGSVATCGTRGYPDGKPQEFQMMHLERVTSVCAALLVAIVGATKTADAQGRDVRAAVHYQLLHVEGTTFPAGVNAEVSTAIRSPLVLVANAGWAPKHTEVPDVSATASIINFGAGLRLMRTGRQFRPFVEVVGGGVTLSVRGTIGSVSGSGSQTWFQLEPGAGFHVDIGRRAAFAASVHVRRVFVDTDEFESAGTNHFRALAGLSVQLFD